MEIPSSHIEYTFHVNVEDVIPAFFLGKVVIRAAPCNSRVINEDMELGLVFLELSDDGVASSFTLH